jgi:hypothetical protein
MLSALVKHRHNNADPASLAADGTYNSLKVLEMIVGTHRYCTTVHIVGDTVIENVAYNINVVTSEGVMNSSLRLTAAESRAHTVNKECTVIIVSAPILEIKINLLCEILAASHSYNTEFSV